MGDGAIGTQLQTRAQAPIALPELLILEPAGRDWLRRVHADYLTAGAQILETSTFALNPLRLEPYHLAAACEQLIADAVALARASVESRALVAGSVGPLDLGLAIRDFPLPELESAFRRPIRALQQNGVDLLMLETFSSPMEARLALTEAARVDLPVFFSIGGQAICRPFAHRTVLELVTLAEEFNVQALGINCVAPYDLTQVLPLVLNQTRLPLLAYPNAGTPTVSRGVVHYDLPVPALLAEARAWYRQGVAIFGGCCGTGPEHIRALAAEFSGRPVNSRDRVMTVSAPSQPRGKSAAPVQEDIANPVRQRLRQGPRPLIAVEIKPTLRQPLADTVAAVKPLAEAGVDFFDVPDNPGANPGRDCMACGALLQQSYSVPVIIHKTATQTNALHLHSYLLGAADLGLRSILAVTGDAPHVGSFDRLASRVTDVRSSVELLRLITLLRQGTMMNGQPLPQPVDFAAGCAFAPGDHLRNQLAWLRRKIEAGAEFVFTQPFFSKDDFARMRTACAQVTAPILAGILPVMSVRQARYLHSGKIPGIRVPDAMLQRLERFSQAEDQIQCGLESTNRLIEELAPETEGFYLILPLHARAISWGAAWVRLIRKSA